MRVDEKAAWVEIKGEREIKGGSKAAWVAGRFHVVIVLLDLSQNELLATCKYKIHFS